MKIAKLALAAILFLSSCTKEPMTSLVPKTVVDDPSLPSITVDGIKLHSEAFGHPDSTLVVCLHGGPGTDYRELRICEGLAGHGYRVVLFDQVGSGLSQRMPSDYYSALGEGVIDMMYDELSGVIAHYRTHPTQKVVLLGHSWGAMLATGYAAKYPERIQGLVVSEPGGLKWEDIMTLVGKERSYGLWSEAMGNTLYLDQFMTGKQNQQEILDYKMVMIGSKNELTGEYPELGFWRYGAVINASLFKMGQEYDPDFSLGLSNFKKPVLFMYSEKNQAYSDAWAQKISSAYPSPTVFKIWGIGHSGIYGNKTAFEEQTMPKVLAYLKTVK